MLLYSVGLYSRSLCRRAIAHPWFSVVRSSASLSTRANCNMDGSADGKDEERAVAENVVRVRELVEKAAAARPAELQSKPPRLVAVSKTKPVSHLIAAYNAGQRHFGENYVQELVEKASKWHFIGHLQSNKCKDVMSIPNLYCLETVDSVKLATALNNAAVKLNRAEPLRVLVQVNTSGEKSKSGTDDAGVLALVRHVTTNCPRLVFAGLMTIGDPDWDRNSPPNPDFKALAACRDVIARELGVPAGELELSMGMSGDFEHAIEMGSTNVRVGSVIFGPRWYPPKPK